MVVVTDAGDLLLDFTELQEMIDLSGCFSEPPRLNEV